MPVNSIELKVSLTYLEAKQVSKRSHPHEILICRDLVGLDKYNDIPMYEPVPGPNFIHIR